MKTGEVRVAEDEDFQQFKGMCTETAGWKEEYHKHGTIVSTKANDVSDFKLIRVQTTFKEISAPLLYDVLHDPEYHRTWDKNMLESYEICCLNPNNDIGYYALKSPKPLKNRDFVIQRSWLDTGKEYFIINHSVNHQSHPPRKGIIRGLSHITGYYIVPLKTPMQPGCTLHYCTQSDPKGKLPVWVVNKLTTLLIPKIMKRISKACHGYDKWKAANNPNLKPWLYPEQMTLPRLDMSEIRAIDEYQSMESVDESSLVEDEVEEGTFDIDDL